MATTHETSFWRENFRLGGYKRYFMAAISNKVSVGLREQMKRSGTAKRPSVSDDT